MKRKYTPAELQTRNFIPEKYWEMIDFSNIEWSGEERHYVLKLHLQPGWCYKQQGCHELTVESISVLRTKQLYEIDYCLCEKCLNKLLK